MEIKWSFSRAISGLLPPHHGDEALDLGGVGDLSGGGSGGEFPSYGGWFWLNFGVS